MVVGPSMLFLSGISQYVARLTGALAGGPRPVAVLLLRRLCPRFIYPGRKRVGQALSGLAYPSDVPVYDGLDWWWGHSLPGALRFWRQVRPRVVVLQWWTGTVAHTYLLLAWLARRSGATLVIEFHEILDVGEARLPLAGRYARWVMNRLLTQAKAVVVHSEHDRAAIQHAYRLDGVPVAVIGVGPYDHYAATRTRSTEASEGAEGRTLRLLYAGVIRPYKGLEELAVAFGDLLTSGEDVHLTVVGEVWQGYRTPLEMLARLGTDRVRVIEGYVSDEEFAAHFGEADVVVLPYRRSSASGPLHVAMSNGLPVVVTAVGGLVEAAREYGGAVLVPACDPAALADGIRRSRFLTSRRHDDPHSWAATERRFDDLFTTLLTPRDGREPASGALVRSDAA
jgi:glycosyltransferase involved in cell wall biosynthesis